MLRKKKKKIRFEKKRDLDEAFQLAFLIHLCFLKISLIRQSKKFIVNLLTLDLY